MKFGLTNRSKIEKLNDDDIDILRSINEKIYLDKKTTETVLYDNLRINALHQIFDSVGTFKPTKSKKGRKGQIKGQGK